MNYYFVVNAFPPLELGVAPQMSYEDIRQLLLLNLNQLDLEQIRKFQLQTDIRNLRALWLGQPLDPRGNFVEKELDEALLVKDLLPSFVGDYLDRYESLDLRLRCFASLYASLYSELQQESVGFLGKLMEFEREIRLCFVALRAKKMDLDLSRELQFEDPTEPFVAQLLAQKEGKEVLLPQEYENLKTAFLEHDLQPGKLHWAISEFKMNRIIEMGENDPFGMSQILGYLARLMIVEEWQQHDPERGRILLEQLSR
jgi:hypothetical protein